MNFLRKQMKWVMAIIVVAFLLSTFLMYEGRGTRRTPGRNPDGSMSDYEVAQINGRSLMRSELERRLRDYLSSYSTRSAASLDMSAIYQAVLDQAIIEAQLAKEVEDRGIRVSDAEADRAMKDYADRYFPTREMFYQALAASGMKVEDYKRELARQLATQTVINAAIGEIVISEDKALEFYETMKGLIYSKPEGFNIHMADFRTSGDAEFLRGKIAAGEKWAEIVSSDVLASHDVINVTRQPVFLPESAFRTGALSVLASLDVGQVSPVFSVSSNDYAVALKAEHIAASTTPYAEVSADIRALLRNQEERVRLTAYQTELRGKAQVVINDPELFARPAVSPDTPPAVEEVIPELAPQAVSTDAPAVTAPVSAEPVAPVEAPAPTETPAPVEATPAPVSEEPVAPVETPAVVSEEPVPATVEATPAPVSAEPAAPAETPAVVSEEAAPATTEAPAPVEPAPAPVETPAPAPVSEDTTPAE